MMSVSKFQELGSSDTTSVSDAAPGQQQQEALGASAFSPMSVNEESSPASATCSASTSYTSLPFTASPATSSITHTSLLPSPIVTSVVDGPKRKYSRPASLRSFSSSTQMTTVVTATASAVSSPSTSQFPNSSNALASGPMPIPTPRRHQQNSNLNYRAINTTVPVATTSWSLSESRTNELQVKSENAHYSYERSRRLSVVINVYDMLQDSKFAPLMWILGIGVYHSAVEIDGREYAYGGHEEPGISGVYSSKSKTPLPGGITCKTSILHGYTSYSPAEFHAIISDLSSEYMGTSYNLLYKNCNHFTNSLVLRLTDRSAPAWLNRATYIGIAIPCIIGQTYIEPPKCDVPGCKSSASLSSASTRDEKSFYEINTAPLPVNQPSLPTWSSCNGTTSSQSPSLSLSSPVRTATDTGRAKKFGEKSSHSQHALESEPFLISTRYVDDEFIASDSGSGSGSDSEDDRTEDDGIVGVDEKTNQTPKIKSSSSNTSKSKRSSGVIYEKTSTRTYSSLSQSQSPSFDSGMRGNAPPLDNSVRYYRSDESSSNSADTDGERSSMLGRFLSGQSSFLGWSEWWRP
ncbi:PPPDE putative peptidase domain-containing protein [Lipomyces kononenkoae]|uniref:PPPDE putative peptidase domain-containing protein n=1 Tax=Lipomyces kononenkoae TaxID=34357 RepID=A0ACC3T3C9_LIPKO